MGETFDVTVRAQEILTLGDLTAFGFDVTSPFSLDSYSINSDYFDQSIEMNNISGVYLSLGNAGQDIDLATLSFTAASAGLATIGIEGIADGFFSGLFYEYGNVDILGFVDINVNGTAPVPEPATMLLFSAGLAGLSVFRKKSKKYNILKFS